MINDLSNSDSETSATADAPADNIVSFIANDLLNICSVHCPTFSRYFFTIHLYNFTF